MRSYLTHNTNSPVRLHSSPISWSRSKASHVTTSAFISASEASHHVLFVLGRHASLWQLSRREYRLIITCQFARFFFFCVSTRSNCYYYYVAYQPKWHRPRSDLPVFFPRALLCCRCCPPSPTSTITTQKKSSNETTHSRPRPELTRSRWLQKAHTDSDAVIVITDDDLPWVARTHASWPQFLIPFDTLKVWMPKYLPWWTQFD